MNSLETLKQELLNQKKEIEAKGGSVSVLNLNPSPSEITQGIKNLSIPDFSKTTATEEDVLEGKTFYSVNSNLKVGSFIDPSEKYEHIFNHMNEVQTSTKHFSYEIPERVTTIRRYMCYENLNFIDIYFNSAAEKIDSYAFSGTKNFKFYNFGDMINLKAIGTYAFNESNPYGLNLSEIPQNITQMDSKAFYEMIKDGDSVNVPPNITTMNSYVFSSSTTKFCENFNLSPTTPISTLSSYLVANIHFNSDLFVPAKVTQVASKFNYNGSFKNITFLGSVTNLASNCFGADSTVPLADIGLKSITFTSTTPPTLGSTPICSQAVSNGLKIYVPDEAVDAYKIKFSSYQQCVKPVSQKP